MVSLKLQYLGWSFQDGHTNFLSKGGLDFIMLKRVYLSVLCSLQVIETTWKTMAKAMDELIISRKEEVSTAAIEGKALGADIFTRLVSEYDADAKHGLDKQEVVSMGIPTSFLDLTERMPQDWEHLRNVIRWSWYFNPFCFGPYSPMIPGLETTARVLGATFGFLAIYPEEQEKALQEIRTVLGDREPVSILGSINPASCRL